MTNPSRSPLLLALLASAEPDYPLASQLAQRLGLPLVPTGTDPAYCFDFDVLLVVSSLCLSLQQTPRLGQADSTGRRGRRGTVGALPGAVAVDFGSAGMRHRRSSGHNELLGKAVGVSSSRQLRVIDATAGLGRDSFVLADLGCAVTLCEREPVIATLLEFALADLAGRGDVWQRQVVQAMTLHAGDARSLASAQLAGQDIIYLDPMFPPRDKSAAVKKEMALFQRLLENRCDELDGDTLLHWALAQEVARVVVKRPARAPHLAGREPSHSIAGKAVRFDVHVKRALA